MKGQAVVWFRVLAGIFFVGLMYMIWSNVLYVYIQPMMVPQIMAMNDSTNLNKTQVLATLSLIQVVWQYWPVIFIFGLMFYGFVASQRREPDEITNWG